MYIYLDESGDTSFKFRNGATRHFVIALVFVDDPIPLHAAIDDCRTALHWPDSKEFHFSGMRDHSIRRFFEAVRPHPFGVRSLIVEKDRLHSTALREKETFYNFLVKMILENDFGDIRDATLVIDESVQSKTKQQHFASYLRKNLNPPNSKAPRKISTVKFHRSHSDNLIQLADMVAGAIRHAHDTRDEEFRAMFRRKILDTRVFPQK